MDNVETPEQRKEREEREKHGFREGKETEQEKKNES